MTTQRVRVAEQVMARQVGEETVMLDLESGTYFGLDPVGARIWQLLEQGRAREEICEALASEYDAPREQIEADVSTLLAELASHGLTVSG